MARRQPDLAIRERHYRHAQAAVALSGGRLSPQAQHLQQQYRAGLIDATELLAAVQALYFRPTP